MHKGYLHFYLQDVLGHLVPLCREQSGSRFLQINLRIAEKEDFDQGFNELLMHSNSLAVHVFGNYVIQVC